MELCFFIWMKLQIWVELIYLGRVKIFNIFVPKSCEKWTFFLEKKFIFSQNPVKKSLFSCYFTEFGAQHIAVKNALFSEMKTSERKLFQTAPNPVEN